MPTETTQYTDIMLDLETFGVGNDAAIVSIGAVAFRADHAEPEALDQSPDVLLSMGKAFQAHVDLDASHMTKRGDLDPATVEWWLRQSEEARTALVGQAGDYDPAPARVKLGAALERFVAWLYKITPQVRSLRLWSNGPTFDETILRSAFRRYDSPLPLSFRGSRCCRTMLDIADGLGWIRSINDDGLTKHDAMHDAVWQARLVVSQRTYLRERLGLRTAMDQSGGL